MLCKNPAIPASGWRYLFKPLFCRVPGHAKEFTSMLETIRSSISPQLRILPPDRPRPIHLAGAAFIWKACRTSLSKSPGQGRMVYRARFRSPLTFPMPRMIPNWPGSRRQHCGHWAMVPGENSMNKHTTVLMKIHTKHTSHANDRFVGMVGSRSICKVLADMYFNQLLCKLRTT